MSDRKALSERLKAQAYGLGFDLAGITTLGEPATRAQFDTWLAAGYHGEMGYLDGDGAELRRDARRPHPGATHALVLAMSYGGREPSGPVARYARGDDYHEVLRERVRELHHWLERETGQTINARPYVDSGPILERDLAQRAGLGWFGKNTMLINPRIGSFFFIASLFVEFELEPDAPFEADRCGTCTRCLDACPTQAFVAPHVLDANKCISYLTIELRGAIDEALRAAVGDRVYGCDVCQDVCPWNRKFALELAQNSPFAPRDLTASSHSRELALELSAMSPAEYASVFRGSAMKRAKLRGLRRNAAVVLGNSGAQKAITALSLALDDEDPLLRSHAAWALGRIASFDARVSLECRLDREVDRDVRVALMRALESSSA
ncbi:MAG: tRNA epoxyqueuosine(34) reductase QueG [Gemmatimonadaceae bacterium]|nr:tRNA epoxyqueuosine(34) reductase QueG [Gemmatimonadaceae bacterium]MCC6244783.1 tRNA epoxyqueuosine(34) reductase QueG [Gemmatimonadaceae bacterium]